MGLFGSIRSSRDLAVEGRKARDYDEFSRTYRMKDLEQYACTAASELGGGAAVLDVATGPGYFCTELAKLGDYEVTGLDISPDMVDIARANALRSGARVDFVQGSASALPFAPMSFDLVFCSWSVKNFMDPTGALGEMYRVLRPGGTALIIDLDHDATSRGWDSYAAGAGLKRMAAFSMRIAFTIQRSGAYSQHRFEELIAATPFADPEIEPCMGINLCVRLRKPRADTTSSVTGTIPE